MYKYKIWDRKTPINGQKADEIFKRKKRSKEGFTYLIYDEDDNLIMMQSIHPHKPGDTAMSFNEAVEMAEESIQVLENPEVITIAYEESGLLPQVSPIIILLTPEMKQLQDKFPTLTDFQIIELFNKYPNILSFSEDEIKKIIEVET